MSNFLANLNTSPNLSESKDDFAQLDLFASTDFLNFDLLEPLSQSVDFDQQGEATADATRPWSTALRSPDILGNEFQFNAMPLPTSHQSSDSSPSANFPIADSLFTAPHGQSISSLQTTSAKRKLDLLQANLIPAERARIEAEEDKRRRNTAASARFRVKKKQREQALEKTAKEMTEKANRLEKRVHELELENKWLKGLITEKTGGKEFSELFAKFLADNGDNSHSEDDNKERADIPLA